MPTDLSSCPTIENLSKIRFKEFVINQDEVALIVAEVAAVIEDNIFLNQLFDSQHKRTVKADKLWQKAHDKPHTMPDLGALIDWLLEARYRLQDVMDLDDEGADSKEVFVATMNALGYLNPQDFPGLIRSTPKSEAAHVD